jgi:NAD(P)-dependent dehydrogenase (short-subunit alcohol dehydrogenase family)
MGRSRVRQVLAGRVALITGASGCIGRAIALGFAEAGADVVLVARRVRPLVELTHAVQAGGRRALLVVADVAVERAMKRVLQQVDLVFPRIDILVNNAGVLPPMQPAHEMPLSDWDRVLAVNLRGPFQLSRLVLPRMLEAGYGRIINVTGDGKAEPGQGAYAVSKTALRLLTQIMGRELKGTGVLVNALDPGRVRSEMAPDAPEEPESVVPLAIRLASLPKRGATGREFARSR